MTEAVPTVARRYLIRGRVQGVGFRFFVVGWARELGLTGFTRNLPDGRVEVLGQGPAADLDRLVEALREGPALSRVDSVDVSETPLEAGRRDFHIQH